MSNKRYMVRYELAHTAVVTAVSTWSELNDLIKGEAKNSIVECKVNENMPKLMFNLIVNHNAEIHKKSTKDNQ